MNPIDDEILNQYIDGSLESTKLNEVKEQLMNSDIDKKRLGYLQVVHNELSKIKTFQTSAAFTDLVMSKLGKKFKVRKEDRFFILSISSLFLTLCLAIIIYLFINIITDSSATSSVLQKADYYFSYLMQFTENARNIFSSKYISIFGSIISFGLLTLIYFLYEEHKLVKRKLGQ